MLSAQKRVICGSVHNHILVFHLIWDIGAALRMCEIIPVAESRLTRCQVGLGIVGGFLFCFNNQTRMDFNEQMPRNESEKSVVSDARYRLALVGDPRKREAVTSSLTRTPLSWKMHCC